MNDRLKGFLKEKDDALYFSGDGELLIFVPEIFFSRNHAIIEGDVINLIGVLNYMVVDKLDPELDIAKEITASKGKSVKRFDYPSAFSTRPQRVEKVKNLKLKPNAPAEDYRVLHYQNNDHDQIFVSLEVPQDIANVEELMSIFINTGKIPYGIKYNELHNYFVKTMSLNGGSFKTSMQLFGVVVSELARDPHNINKPFRLSSNFEKDQYSYRPISIKEIAKIASPFTAMVTENWDEAVINAGLIDDENAIPTPMEPIMTGDL